MVDPAWTAAHRLQGAAGQCPQVLSEHLLPSTCTDVELLLPSEHAMQAPTVVGVSPEQQAQELTARCQGGGAVDVVVVPRVSLTLQPLMPPVAVAARDTESEGGPPAAAAAVPPPAPLPPRWFEEQDAVLPQALQWPLPVPNPNSPSAVEALVKARGWKAGEERSKKTEDGFSVASHFVYAGELGGALIVPSTPPAMSSLRAAMVSDVHRGVFYGITENKTTIWAAYLDLDFTAELSVTAIVRVARVCHYTVAEHYPGIDPRHLRAIICVGRTLNKGSAPAGNHFSTGLHIVWPDICVDISRQVELAISIRKTLNSVLFPAPAAQLLPDGTEQDHTSWDTIVDLGVYRHSTGLRMVYCPKPRRCLEKTAHSIGKRSVCTRCRRGFQPNPLTSVYMPFFALCGRQGLTRRTDAPPVPQAALVALPHAVCPQWQVATPTLLALCSIRRPGMEVPSPNFKFIGGKSNVPPEVWKSLHCNAQGMWLGRRSRTKEVVPYRYEDQTPGPVIKAADRAYAVLRALVRRSSPRYRTAVLTSITTYLNPVKHIALYVIMVEGPDSSQALQHNCANVLKPHRSSSIYFQVGAGTRKLIQRCTCKKARCGHETISGKRCSQFSLSLVDLNALEIACLFPQEPLTAEQEAELKASPETLRFADVTACEMNCAARERMQQSKLLARASKIRRRPPAKQPADADAAGELPPASKKPRRAAASGAGEPEPTETKACPSVTHSMDSKGIVLHTTLGSREATVTWLEQQPSMDRAIVELARNPATRMVFVS